MHTRLTHIGAGLALFGTVMVGTVEASAQITLPHTGVRAIPSPSATPSTPALPRGLDRSIHLPADAAAHTRENREWWYFVGHLSDTRGHTYGFETTIAKVGGIQQIVPGSPYDTDYHTDVSVTDDHAGRFYQQMSFMGPNDAALSTRTLDARAGQARITTVGTPDALTYRVQGSVPGAASDLVVTSTRPALLVGGGLIPWGDGYTYYYTLTSLRTHGTLTIGGRRIPVHGIAWMDHQWGKWASVDVRPAGVTNWEWMGMQLSDGTDINMAVQNTVRGAFGGASALLPNNRQVPIIKDVSMTPLGQWRSPTTHIVYPSGWHVRVPSLKLDVIVRPTVKGQELVDSWAVMGYRTAYYEGNCTVTGTQAGRHVSGATYTELIGYGLPSLPQLG
jgi:predicted secreted hydrolase